MGGSSQGLCECVQAGCLNSSLQAQLNVHNSDYLVSLPYHLRMAEHDVAHSLPDDRWRGSHLGRLMGLAHAPVRRTRAPA